MSQPTPLALDLPPFRAALWVPGDPRPQGSKSAIVRGARAVVVEGKGPGRKALTEWRTDVRAAATRWCEEHERSAPFDGPVAVWLTFYRNRPTSLPKRVAWPMTKPDVDKLSRAVLDALTSVLIHDDARVVDLHAIKRFATVDQGPGCVVRVEELTS